MIKIDKGVWMSGVAVLLSLTKNLPTSNSGGFFPSFFHYCGSLTKNPKELWDKNLTRKNAIYQNSGLLGIFCLHRQKSERAIKPEKEPKLPQGRKRKNLTSKKNLNDYIRHTDTQGHKDSQT